MKHQVKRERIVLFIAVDHFTVEADSVESAAEIAKERLTVDHRNLSDSEIVFNYSILKEDSEEHVSMRSVNVTDPVTGSEIEVDSFDVVS